MNFYKLKKIMYVVLLSYTLYLFPGSSSSVTIPGFSTLEKCQTVGDKLKSGFIFGTYKCSLAD